MRNGEQDAVARKGRTAFVGIDVAFAKRKRLPISVCVLDRERPVPLPLRNRGCPLPPIGRGNPQVLDADVVSAFAVEALAFLREIERTFDVGIARVAIDAPRDFSRESESRRLAEKALDGLGVSCFATPSRSQFEAIVRKARNHLAAGLPVNRLPHSHQLWMLAGFALFRELAQAYECIEVYPHAIAGALGCSGVHKSRREGFEAQLAATAEATGWRTGELRAALSRQGYGSRHDKLDAFMSAWVASLPESRRTAHGVPPDDAIWVPIPL